MSAVLRKLAVYIPTLTLFSALSFAQVTSIEGDVKDENGKPVKDAIIKIERKDIKGNYKTKTDKKGHYFHAGLPLGMYKITLEIEGKDVDMVDNIRTRLGDPLAVDFNLAQVKARQQAAEAGVLSKEQERAMTPQQRADYEKKLKEQAAAMQKNKALNDAFNAGKEAMNAKNFDVAVQSFEKAAEIDPQQHVVWGNLAEAYVAQAGTKTGADQQAALDKGLAAFQKAIEIKPDDAAYHNNYALALVKAKKIDEAQAELNKAAQIDPTNAGKYYYNLGAVLVNTGQSEPAGAAFKKAIDADPNYAAAYYQYGIYLIGKAKTTPDGKIVPPDGTKEMFEKYLSLEPNGPNADAAKAMLQSIGSSIETEFAKPGAKKTLPKKK